MTRCMYFMKKLSADFFTTPFPELSFCKKIIPNKTRTRPTVPSVPHKKEKDHMYNM